MQELIAFAPPRYDESKRIADLSPRALKLLTFVLTCLSFLTMFSGASAEVAGPVLHPGDQITIIVFDHPELSTTGYLTSAGSISLPILGNVDANGVTTSVVAGRVRAALLAYVKFPAVDVRIVQQGQSIFVTGAFVGSIPYVPGMTLTSAIGELRTSVARTNPLNLSASQTQDPSANAYDLRNVRLQHDGKIVGPFNIETLYRSANPGPDVAPGDRILLASKPIRVDFIGDVKQPGPIFLYRGESLAQALTEAGGVDPTASLTHITLLRDGVMSDVSSAGSVFTAPAKDGDVLTMRPAPHVTVAGLVTTPGDTELRTNTNLLNALYDAGGPLKNADLKHVKVVHQSVPTEYNLLALAHGDLTQNPPLSDGDSIFIPQGRGIDPSVILQALGGVSVFRYLL